MMWYHLQTDQGCWGG